MLRKRSQASANQLSQLPILRHSERGLNELRLRSSTSINHVIRVVERDPALTLELFVAANRELKRAGKPPATNIRRALLVFGLARYLEQSKSFQTIENRLAPQYLRPVLNHLGRSYLAARIAERLAKMRGHINIEDAFCFGLMRDLDRYAGKLISAANVMADVLNLRTLLPGLGSPLSAGDPLYWCADNASKFALATQYAWNESNYSPIISSIADSIDAHAYDVETLLMNTTVTAALETRHFNDFPAARNLMNPGPQKPLAALLFPEERQNQAVPISPFLTSGKRPATNAKAEPLATSDGSQEDGSDPFLLDEKNLIGLEKAIGKAGRDLDLLGSEKSTRTRILPFALNVMTSVLKAKQTLFIANPGDGRLIVRLVASRDNKPKSTNLALETDANMVLRKGIANGRPLHINAQQLKVHGELFDKKLSALLGESEVYSIPLKTNKKVIGILLTRFDQNTTNNWPAHFKLCNRLAVLMVHALSATSG